ncbi:MAG: hypothetical protein ACREBS_00960 [Nitrososphaerales archaeon]
MQRSDLAQLRTRFLFPFLSGFVNRGDYVFVFLLYILATILFTWPLAQNFTTFVNGNQMDVFHELWYLRLGSTAPFGPFFLFSTSSSYYPTGVPLYFQVISPFNTLVFGVLARFFGEIVAYNLLYMFTFYFGAYATYVLVYYLTNNKYGAFFAGLAFAFAPIHTGQGLAHLNIMSSEFIPLFLYFLIRMAREVSMWNPVYSAIALILNAMCDLHMLLICTAILIVFVAYYLFAQRRMILNRPFIKRLGIMIVLSGLLGFIVYFQTAYGLLFVPKSIGSTSSIVEFLSAKSADIYSFFLPPSGNPFFRSYTAQYYNLIYPNSALPTSPLDAYLGVSVVTMAIVGIIAYRHKREIYLWLILAVVGFLLALGPYVHVEGVVTPIPALWAYLYYLVPIFNSFRAPYRFDYITALGLAILAGYGISTIMSKIDERRRKRTNGIALATLKLLVMFLLCLVLVAEFLTIPYPEFYGPVPNFYQTLANDPSNFTVLEVPTQARWSLYLYYESAYNAPLINGNVPRIPRYPQSFLEATPFINELGHYRPGRASQDIINGTPSAIALAPYILAQYNIRYVILHKDLFRNSTAYISYAQLVSQVAGAPIYQDSTIIAWKFQPQQNSSMMSYFQYNGNVSLIGLLYGGWYPHGLFGAHTRAIDVFGGVNLFSAGNQYVQFEFKVRGIGGNYPLQLSLDGQMIGTYLAENGAYTVYTTPYVFVPRGESQLLFYSIDGCKIPTTPTAFNVPLQRITSVSCVSAQFSWIDPITATTTVES